VLHHDEGEVAFRAGIEDHDDIRMREGGDVMGLSLKTLLKDGIVSERTGENLARHLTMERLVVSTPHHTRTPGADHLQ
jgi:hypothetical protein